MTGSISILAGGAPVVALTRSEAVIEVTTRGPRGDPGGGVQRVASEAVGGHRVVRGLASGEVALASASDASHVATLLGVTTGAAAAGGTLSITLIGDIEEGSWNWSPGPVYLGESGVLTQTAPTTGHLVQVGVSDKPTRLSVRLQPPIKLG